jgi:hypothetical protein
MAIVIITGKVYEDIAKKFSKIEGNRIIDLLETLEENPHKGKEISSVGKILIKEIKYEKYRFYFITDGFKIKILKAEELKDLIIKFVRMSEKKDQQKTIEEIKQVLRSLDGEGF